MKKNLNLWCCIGLLFLFSIGGCRKESIESTSNSPVADTVRATDPPKGAVTAKFLALGDSYTIGQNVTSSERFPAQTVQLLTSRNIIVTDLQYVAQTGWTTSNLAFAISSLNVSHEFDIVTLLIGVNDQYQARDTTGYALRFEALLNKAIAFAGNQKANVFVISIPDYSVTPFVSTDQKTRVSEQIDQFNAINKQITLQYNIAYLDITPSTRQAANDPSLIANDGLHPSGREYKKWADMLAPLIEHALK